MPGLNLLFVSNMHMHMFTYVVCDTTRVMHILMCIMNTLWYMMNYNRMWHSINYIAFVVYYELQLHVVFYQLC